MNFITLNASGAVDFRQDTFMILLALGVVAFVVIQSLYFIKKAWSRATELGISKETSEGISEESFFSWGLRYWRRDFPQGSRASPS